MKKTVSTVLLIVLMLVFLTGCLSVNYEVTVNEDGSGKISYVYGYQKEYLDDMETNSGDMLEEARESAKEEGFTVEPYSDDKYEGFKATKNLEDVTKEVSLSEIFGSEYVIEGDDNSIKIDKNKYSQDARIDLSSMEDMSMFGIVMKYKVNLPVKAGENNATTVSEDGKTLTWNLKAGEVNPIQFEAKNTCSIWVYLGIGAVILIVVAVVVLTIVLKKGKVKEEAPKEE